jgi:excisionase family DNA binding protein
MPDDDLNGNPENPNYVGIREAARILVVSETTVRSAIHRGNIPFRIAYGHTVVARSDLEDYKTRTQPLGKPKRGRPKKSPASP